MKKIYEKPMVELTKFDVEDIITASGTSFSTKDEVNQTAEIQASVKAADGGYDAVSVYNW